MIKLVKKYEIKNKDQLFELFEQFIQEQMQRESVSPDYKQGYSDAVVTIMQEINSSQAVDA